MNDALQQQLDRLTGFLTANPLVGAWYTTVVRFVFPLLALMILVGAIRSLWKVKHPDEVWAYLVLRNGVRLPVTHWENIIGRAAASDVQLEYPSVSRQHAALIRQDDGSWVVYDLGAVSGAHRLAAHRFAGQRGHCHDPADVSGVHRRVLGVFHRHAAVPAHRL